MALQGFLTLKSTQAWTYRSPDEVSLDHRLKYPIQWTHKTLPPTPLSAYYGLRGLDNEKDAMTSGCLDRKEIRGAIWGVHSTTDRPANGNTGRLFLAFGGPVCADRISNCPLDRVLTYKNLIYLLNLQFGSNVQNLNSKNKIWFLLDYPINTLLRIW